MSAGGDVSVVKWFDKSILMASSVFGRASGRLSEMVQEGQDTCCCTSASSHRHVQ